MRVPLSLIAMLAALISPAPAPALAAGGPAWEACVGLASKPDERIKPCSTVIETKSESGSRLAVAYCNRGHGLTEKRELDAAQSDLDEAIRLEPCYACAYNNRGRVYSFKRDYDRAITDYDQAIKLDPSLALAYGNRGESRFNKGDLDGAFADFDAAIKRIPNTPWPMPIAHWCITAGATWRTPSPTTPCGSSLRPICSPISTAATSIATASSSIAPPPIMARRSVLRRPTRAAGAIVA